MKLIKLELSGFKSFADTVTLGFDDGVTAIVGPNGCGKSNVSDAVRWVLGEQSARLLRGGKMEDVIFQGSSGRRPVNVTEVSLFLDNGDGQLPIAYREVMITRRLSRSGQSDYLLNGAPVRLRDIQDLLRGTGLGSDAGVVIEAKMIDWLLSDREGERRSLFEEAAGIGLYRDRRQSTERRLEETALDLQRVEDLIGEVQTQIRSLARQRGKAERHAKLVEEKFAVQVNLARRHLEAMAGRMAGIEARQQVLTELLPAAREAVSAGEVRREQCAQLRTAAEFRRTDITRRLGEVRVELGKVESDLALAAERRAHAASRRLRASEERAQLESRAQQAARDREAAAEEHHAALGTQQAIQSELASRAQGEQEVRRGLAEQRELVRTTEGVLQQDAQTLRSLDGERLALEGDLASLAEQATQAATRRSELQREVAAVERKKEEALALADHAAFQARQRAGEAERSRHQVAQLRELEALQRATRRQSQETLAQLAARRQALEELERDRVGLAPGAAALMAAREHFGDTVLGPLSDFIRTSRKDAELAERLLGNWVHAVLVKDLQAAASVQAWHAESQPGMIALLPVDPGPQQVGEAVPLEDKLRADRPARAWVRALLAGSEILDESGRALRRANGAILLAGRGDPSGPLRRRAELESLTQEVAGSQQALDTADADLQGTIAQLAEAEAASQTAMTVAEEAREAERRAVTAREDATRQAGNLARELSESEGQWKRVTERVDCSRQRVAEIDAALTEGELARARMDEQLAEARVVLAELEGAQEAARESRVHWQVQEAQVSARLQAASERLQRAAQVGSDAQAQLVALADELAQLENDGAALSAQEARWTEAEAERRMTLLEIEAATAGAESALAKAETDLTGAETALTSARADLELLSEEHHRLQLEITEAGGFRRNIIERVEAEWRRPISALVAEAPVLDLDAESLEAEAGRIVSNLEAIGPVNALAVEEHAEESKRLEFLSTQRDDLVAARQSLHQAIREIDTTARAMFLETFNAVRDNFGKVFQTLFGGGECELRLVNPDDPLESEIDIHAAPRGKRTQRIHLLSSGERTLVAASLLFSIYLTKPSPFCLMDEVDAPLDDANVGRFTRLLDEFKPSTQFIVITHNPRTMQSADAVYGVTMQEPGVSTIVGVRLGATEPA